MIYTLYYYTKTTHSVDIFIYYFFFSPDQKTVILKFQTNNKFLYKTYCNILYILFFC